MKGPYLIATITLVVSACEERQVHVYAVPGARIEARTDNTTNGCIDVKVEPPGLKIPVLVPMPMPYERATAEKPEGTK